MNSVDFIDEENELSSASQQSTQTTEQSDSFIDKIGKRFHLSNTGIKIIVVSAILLFFFCSAVFMTIGLSKQKVQQNTRQDFINRFGSGKQVTQ